MPTLNDWHDAFERLGIGLPEGFWWNDTGTHVVWPNIFRSEEGPAAHAICLAAAVEWLWAHDEYHDKHWPAMPLGGTFAQAIWHAIQTLAAARA